MAKSSEEVAAHLPAARAGSRSARGRVLESCRSFLLRLAHRRMDRSIQAKVGASDLVQITFLEADRDFAGFHGHSRGELRAWLATLLRNNALSLRRWWYRLRRTPNRECSLFLQGSEVMPGSTLPTAAPSPAQAASQAETLARVRQAIERLPADYRTVLNLRYEEGLAFEEVGQRMNRTANAARKLWVKAIERLQQQLRESHESL